MSLQRSAQDVARLANHVTPTRPAVAWRRPIHPHTHGERQLAARPAGRPAPDIEATEPMGPSPGPALRGRGHLSREGAGSRQRTSGLVPVAGGVEKPLTPRVGMAA
jgi:hypothetical protein